MPVVELLPVPRRDETMLSYLNTNFRRIADAIALAADTLSGKDITINSAEYGVILTAPNGNRFRIIVSNAGVLTTEPV